MNKNIYKFNVKTEYFKTRIKRTWLLFKCSLGVYSKFAFSCFIYFHLWFFFSFTFSSELDSIFWFSSQIWLCIFDFTIIIIFIIVAPIWVFHTSVSQWFPTRVWVTTSLLKFPGLSTVFWPILNIRLFGRSPPILLFLSLPFFVPIIQRLYRAHHLQLASPSLTGVSPWYNG